MPCRVPAAAADDAVDPPVNRVDRTSPIGLRSFRWTLRPPPTDADIIAVRGEVEAAGRGGSIAGTEVAAGACKRPACVGCEAGRGAAIAVTGMADIGAGGSGAAAAAEMLAAPAAVDTAGVAAASGCVPRDCGNNAADAVCGRNGDSVRAACVVAAMALAGRLSAGAVAGAEAPAAARVATPAAVAGGMPNLPSPDAVTDGAPAAPAAAEAAAATCRSDASLPPSPGPDAAVSEGAAAASACVSESSGSADCGRRDAAAAGSAAGVVRADAAAAPVHRADDDDDTPLAGGRSTRLE